MKRQKIGKCYVQRKRNGQFKSWARIGRSLAADRRKISFNHAKSGYGHRGDGFSLSYFASTRRLLK